MKILVSYNGTNESHAALDLAQTHAKIFNAQLVVVSSSEGGKGEKLDDINKIKQDLEKIQEEITSNGIKCQVEQLARGLTPGEDIVLYAEENDIDHIYVGIRKKSRTSKLILGSTAQFIILKAGCPVVSVK
ncbi:MAG: universal stress protein [Desulfobacterales bacterium]